MKAAPVATEAAETLQRLAVLLEAGVAPAQAWSLLAEDGDVTALRLLGRRLRPTAEGTRRASPPQHHPLLDPTENMDRLGGAWTDVAVAWRVAQTVGAPLAPSLRQFAGALRSAAEMRDDVAVALADPRATARLVAWLPAVAILLGIALGFDVAAVLVHPVGIGCAPPAPRSCSQRASGRRASSRGRSPTGGWRDCRARSWRSLSAGACRSSAPSP
jgi:tight adherence protein B